MERVLALLAAVPFGIGFAVGVVGGDAGAAEPDTVAFTFADDEIVESSGLVARDGLVVTVNDSGDGNRVFTVDPATGRTVGVTRWQGEADDIEALAPAQHASEQSGAGEVWVGDIGDNAGQRAEVEVARVPFGRGHRTVEAPTYDLVYPDGPHDAETLLVHPVTGRLYVVAKEFIGRLYAAPERLEEQAPNRLTPVDEVLGIATDGAFLPDGRHLVLRNYGQAAFYTWPGLERVALVDLPAQQQGEGIAVSEEGGVLISSEGVHTDVLRVPMPRAVAEAAPADATTAPSASSTPGPTELPAQPPSAPVVAEERSVWPWALGGVAGAVIIVVLLRSLRPR